MKKFLQKIWMLVLVVVLIGGVCACDFGDDYEIVSTPQMTVEYYEYLDYYSADIKGTLKNISSIDWSYCQIEFKVFDAAGNNMGTALANVNNIGAGETWRFSATFLDFSNVRPVSFELCDVTWW